METLKIFNYVIGIVAGISMMCLIYLLKSFLKEVRHNIIDIKKAQMHTFAILSAMKLQGDFEQIRKMTQTLNELVKNEQFAEAQHVKKLIDKLEAQTMEQIREFNNTFGDVAGVKIVTENL